MSGFWAMGGYAAYVWTAYALFLLVLLLDTLLPHWRQRRLLADTRAQLLREQARRQRAASSPLPGRADESHP